VLVGSAATGTLLDQDVPPIVPWLVLAAITALPVILLPYASSAGRGDPAR
jgi:hypothetical protein